MGGHKLPFPEFPEALWRVTLVVGTHDYQDHTFAF
jgi:hypothetical protein